MRERIFDDDIFEDFGEDCYLPYPRQPVSRFNATIVVGKKKRSGPVQQPKPAEIGEDDPTLGPCDQDCGAALDDNESERIIDELRGGVRRYVPRSPGVYGMLDLRGRLIYVGKSKSLRSRLLSYFLPHNEEEKAGRIVQSTQSIVWESQPSEFAALLREQYLIRHFQPRFNVQGMPKRQRPVYLCLGKPPAETLYVSNMPDSRAVACQGPLLGSGRIRRAVEVLNRIFGLRDCGSQVPFSFTDQLQLFDLSPRPGCLRLELQTCLGPCAGACNRSAYEKQVQQARSFLLGELDYPLEKLQQQMSLAASRLHFEQAIRLREDIKHVRWLSRRLETFAEARQKFSFVYPVPSPDGRDCWYIVRQGELCAVLPAPKTAACWRRTKKCISEWLEEKPRVGKSMPSRPETVALIAGWFRANRPELTHVLYPDSIPEWSERKALKSQRA